jgi:hypothetical protein
MTETYTLDEVVEVLKSLLDDKWKGEITLVRPRREQPEGKSEDAMPWVSECKWKCEKNHVEKGINALIRKRYGEYDDRHLVSDAEVDVFLACKMLKLKWSYKNTERILDWLNGKR